MEGLTTLVPVAPEEPLFIVEESVRFLREVGLTPMYVIDFPRPKLRTVIEEHGGSVFVRNTRRGRRGGAINDGLERVDTEFVALLDIDSRPSLTFIRQCIDALLTAPDAFLASGPREVTNEDTGLMPALVSAEYTFIGILYRLIAGVNGFLQFNGLIGVARTAALRAISVPENRSCPDVNFATEAYTTGMKAVLVEETIGEQSPATFSGFYAQRVRWLGGALECLSAHYRDCLGSEVFSTTAKVSWAVELSAPILLPVLFLLLLPVFLVVQVLFGFHPYQSNDKFCLRKAGLIPVIVFCNAICSLGAVISYLLGTERHWETTERTSP